jgi:hypothetical protein
MYDESHEGALHVPLQLTKNVARQGECEKSPLSAGGSF